MTELMNVPQFRKYMSKYFAVREYEQLPKVVQEHFEGQSKKFNHPDYYIPKAALNIVEVNIENFLKVSRLKPRFLINNIDKYKVYFIEHMKPYYQEWRNNEYEFAHSEMLYDLHIYDVEKEKVVGFLEMRLGNNTFETYFVDAFIGWINTDEELRQQHIAKFMMRLSSTYLFYKTRRVLYSGTALSPEMKISLKRLSQSTTWVEFMPHYNDISEDERERWIISPVSFNVSVRDSNNIFKF